LRFISGIAAQRKWSHTFEPKKSGIDVMLKDLDTVQKIAQQAGTDSPVSTLATALYRSFGMRSGSDMTADISVFIKLYESM
jgi:3-hydroxyisobutyrate dehydrogenase-like beta-hydroxyacid dehydrogenase